MQNLRCVLPFRFSVNPHIYVNMNVICCIIGDYYGEFLLSDQKLQNVDFL